MICRFDSNRQYVDDICFGWFQYFQACWDMTMMFKWFEIWVCKHDLRHVLMVYCLLGLRFKLCRGWDLNYANCEGENDMNMKACFEVCFDVVLWVLKWQIWINIDFNWVLLYTEFKI
jgi:hypothetical protein